MSYCFYDKSEWAEDKFGLWSDEYIEAIVNDGICLLPLDHEGDHVFTPDDQFAIVINGDNEPA